MIVTTSSDNPATKANPRAVTGIVKCEKRVELTDLDPGNVHIFKSYVQIIARQGDKKVHWEFFSNNNADVILEPGSVDSIAIDFEAPNENLAKK